MKTFEEYQFRIKHNQLNKKVEYKYSPNTKRELKKAIETELALQGLEADLNCIDTSKIMDMSNLFDVDIHEFARNFNGDISNWDVSNVRNMISMFYHAESFNGDISGWDVSSVEDMNYMFYNAKSFNQDINNWDVSKVENMFGMFWNAESFNGGISKWNVSNVETMNRMFCYARSFNQDISNWDVSNVKDTNYMFDGCPIKKEYKPKIQIMI